MPHFRNKVQLVRGIHCVGYNYDAMSPQSEVRKSRRQRREDARELAKEIVRSANNRAPSPRLDVGWFLAVFIALALLLLAPKIGRSTTFVALIAMACCLIHPIKQLGIVRDASSHRMKRCWFSILMGLAIAMIVIFAIFVWPPLPYYRILSRNDTDLFNRYLGRAPAGEEAIRIGCPQANEEICVIAGQFLPLFQRAGWKVEGNSVQRLVLPKPISGVALFEHGIGAPDPANPEQGLWAQQTLAIIQITKAFTSIKMIPSAAGDSTMPEGVIGIYFGPTPLQ